MSARVALICEAPALGAQFKALAERLEGVLLQNEEGAEFLLVLTSKGLELREVGGTTKPLSVDFSTLLKRRRTGKIEPLARAIGVKGKVRPKVLDLTAGLAQDAFILASYGCKVKMLERSAIVAALLEDALERARTEPELTAIAGQMSLQVGDAKALVASLALDYDVIYIDPMYPKTSKTAAKRKEMRFFRALVGSDPDAPGLLMLALQSPVNRVVVKRPLKAPPLGAKPGASLKGKTTRFDLYIT